MGWRVDGGFGPSWDVPKPLEAHIVRLRARDEVCTHSVSVLARRYDIGGV